MFYYIFPFFLIPILFIAFVVHVLVKLHSFDKEIKFLKRNIGTSNPKENISPPQEIKYDNKIQEQSIVEPIQQAVPQPVQPINPTSYEDDILSDFFNWFKENWVMKLGVLFVLLGFIFFISYAFVVGWIGPFGKIATGFIIGVAIILFANTRMEKNVKQGAPLIILAVAIILFTTYYASYVYEIFNEIISLLVVLIVAGYVNIVALQYNLKSLSVVGLLIAGSAPFFANSSSPNFVFLFSYLAVIVVAHLWIMYYRNWRFLGSISSCLILFYSLIYFGSSLFNSVNSNNLTILLIIMGLAAILFITNVLNISKFKDESSGSDGSLAIFNGVLIGVWVIFDPYLGSLYSSVDVKTLLLAIWMIIFAFGSYFVFIKNNKLSFFYIYSMVSIVYLAILTALQLEGNSLVFAYIFESAAISLIGYFITSKLDVGYKLSLLMIPPALMSLQSFFSSSWRTSIFNQDFAIISSMILILIGVGYFYMVVKKEEDEDYISGLEIKPHSLMIITGSIYLYGLIWVSLTSFYDGSQIAIMLSLAIYTIIGLSCYVFGKVNDRIIFRRYGLFLLLAVIARLLLVDVWSMDTILKVVTFVIIGVMFISTAFIGKDGKENRELSNNNVNN